jgi:hypothetical protein
MRTPRPRSAILILAALAYVSLACLVQGPSDIERHRWWSGLGPVLPHETFPGDCKTCHLGQSWAGLRADFDFDHERETGTALEGVHEQALCLRCHNDRGPVETFVARGCGGCHEDVHQGSLVQACDVCHDQRTWFPKGQVELHARTRLPLVGAHAATSCRRCHLGSEVGLFLPTDPECVSCHQDDLARTTNHVGLGWVDRCDRCHIPTLWQQAEVGR